MNYSVSELFILAILNIQQSNWLLPQFRNLQSSKLPVKKATNTQVKYIAHSFLAFITLTEQLCLRVFGVFEFTSFTYDYPPVQPKI